MKLRSLFGYKEAYLLAMLVIGGCAFYLTPWLWLVYVLLIVAMLARPLDPTKR